MSKTSNVLRVGRLLFLLGLLTGFAVEDGDISSVDAARRLQVTHSLWTSEPPVKKGDYPEFGIIGRDGEIHAWYGMGQSLVMLPADVIGSLLVAKTTPDPASLGGRIKHAFVVYATFPLLTAGCVVLGYLILLQMGLGLRASAIGAMGMLFGTTLLQWTQVNQENNLTLLCFLGVLYASLRWLSSGRLVYMAAAGCVAGFALLTRLPTVFETAAVGLFTLIALFVPGAGNGFVDERARREWLKAGGIFVGVFALFVAAERFYQWSRFGSWTNTYIGVHKEQNPAWYAGGDWWNGVWTLLFSAHDSVFWLEPALWLLALLLLCSFRRVPAGVKYLGFVCVVLMAVLVAFYAPYPWPGGASGWGSRYTTTPVIVLGLLGFGLAARLWHDLPAGLRRVSGAVVVLAVVWQIGSLLHWSVLEQIQSEAWGREHFLVAQRWMNSVVLVGGDFGQSGLMTPGLSDRLLRFNFTPFHVRAELGNSAGVLAFAAWAVLLVLVAALVAAVWRAASDEKPENPIHD